MIAMNTLAVGSVLSVGREGLSPFYSGEGCEEGAQNGSGRESAFLQAILPRSAIQVASLGNGGILQMELHTSEFPKRLPHMNKYLWHLKQLVL